MKQKLSVRTIIKQDSKVLLGRRVGGRESLRGLFELPGGEVAFGESTEQAVQRHLHASLNVEAQTLQLQNVLSEIDLENTSVQHIVIVYQAALVSSGNIEPQLEYDKYVWKKMLEIQPNILTSISSEILNVTEQHTVTPIEHNNNTSNDVLNTTKDIFILYSDGGSRGNPGPSASGFVVMNNHEEVIGEGGKYLGITTNNQAEYQALLLALEEAYRLGARKLECRLDSLLVVNQMNGLYQIKNRELWPIHAAIKEVLARFEKARFVHVRREFNTLADAMVNKILDQETAKHV